MSVNAPQRLRAGLVAAMAVVVFVVAWLFRFNDPGGSFAGLTDDHFFYLARGWQLLFGDLPVRDFVDQGAPLYYYVAAAVQLLFGRGTVSELIFATTVLAACAALVFWLATTASGSIAAGLLAVAFHMHLGPRFYNYPKFLVYVVAIPLCWRFLDRPGVRLRSLIAATTVMGFLFRHDHGVFVALAMAVTLATLPGAAWTGRMKHALLYAVTCALLLAPYAAFVQWNGGVMSYMRQAAAWAQHERQRTPPVWPGLLDNPDGASEAASSGPVVARAVATIQDNDVAWTYYLELAIPLLALLLLSQWPDALRPRWPHARQKLAVVALLGVVLDLGFLRSPLDARLADPSVPHAILLAWLAVAALRVVALGGGTRTRGSAAASWRGRAATAATAALAGFILWSLMSQNFHRRLERVHFNEGVARSFARASDVAAGVGEDWRLESLNAQRGQDTLVALSIYVNACTAPTDRVFVQAYMPQVLGLARRAFAGGHADLRAGFHETEEAQRLTVARLERQSVPMLLMASGEQYDKFRESFPLIVTYFDRHYRQAGTRTFDGRFETTLFVRNDRPARGTYEPFDWPCFADGVVHSDASAERRTAVVAGLRQPSPDRHD